MQIIESQFVKEGNSLLWHTIVPIDYDQPWDVRGIKFLAKVIGRNHDLCNKFLQSTEFQQFIKFSKIDLIVVDHFLQVILFIFLQIKKKFLLCSIISEQTNTIYIKLTKKVVILRNVSQ